MYKISNLTPIANNAKTGVVPALWMYWNEDNDIMTTAGLIKYTGMSIGDQVLVISAAKDAHVLHHVTAKASDGGVTLVVNS